jgi:D-alanyl-D-alanine carboxypeptidase
MKFRHPLLWLGAGVAVLALALGLGLSLGLSSGGHPAANQFQSELNVLVTGPDQIAPGVTAYVSGPRGTWSGAAGLANVSTKERMSPDSRLRLASVSKLWTAAVILRLAEQGTLSLDDTVEHWLPGLLPEGKRITLRELLNNTSGLLDSNDVLHFPQRYFAEVKDAALRAQLTTVARRLAADPATPVDPRLWIRFAAAVPLFFEPGSLFHYSSIGYDIAGLIAEKAGGASFAELVQRLVAEPLRLRSAAYDPRSLPSGPHAHGYRVGQGGALTDTTAWMFGVGQGGGMVSNARDEAAFLTDLVRGKLLDPRSLAALGTASSAEPTYGLGTGIEKSSCTGRAYSHNGGLDGYETNVIVSADGSRVAVLMLNGRSADSAGDVIAEQTMRRLFCAA